MSAHSPALITSASEIPVFSDIVYMDYPLPVANPFAPGAERYLHGQHPYGVQPAGGANTAYMDGHVSWLSPDKLEPMGQFYPRRYYAWWAGHPE
jgi:prepilin-type processing-associated H-X9-DG protein